MSQRRASVFGLHSITSLLLSAAHSLDSMFRSHPFPNLIFVSLATVRLVKSLSFVNHWQENCFSMEKQLPMDLSRNTEATGRKQRLVLSKSSP